MKTSKRPMSGQRTSRLLTMLLGLVSVSVPAVADELSRADGPYYNCNCIVNPAKQSLAVVMREGGTYDTPEIRASVARYLSAVTVSLGVPSAGLCLHVADNFSTLEEFVDSLYYHENVAYAVVVGDEIDLSKTSEMTAIWRIFDELCIVDKAYYLPADSGSTPVRDADAMCKDVAISWVTPPFYNGDADKQAFVRRAFDTYAKYHSNENEILSAFSRAFFWIQWDNTLPTSVGSELSQHTKNYGLDSIFALNTQHDRVASELAKRPMLLHVNVHANQTVMGLGLTPGGESSTNNQVYTTLSEFTNFCNAHGTPALLFDAFACNSMTPSSGTRQNCCWPQRVVDAGVWAYYTVFGNSTQRAQTESVIGRLNTMGYAIRTTPVSDYYVYGDIMAHLLSETATVARGFVERPAAGSSVSWDRGRIEVLGGKDATVAEVELSAYSVTGRQVFTIGGLRLAHDRCVAIPVDLGRGQYVAKLRTAHGSTSHYFTVGE